MTKAPSSTVVYMRNIQTSCILALARLVQPLPIVPLRPYLPLPNLACDFQPANPSNTKKPLQRHSMRLLQDMAGINHTE